MMPGNRIHLFLQLAATLLFVVGVQARTWTSAGGSKTFEGELQSCESASGKVTVRPANGGRMTFRKEPLSEDAIGGGGFHCGDNVATYAKVGDRMGRAMAELKEGK